MTCQNVSGEKGLLYNAAFSTCSHNVLHCVFGCLVSIKQNKKKVLFYFSQERPETCSDLQIGSMNCFQFTLYWVFPVSVYRKDKYEMRWKLHFKARKKKRSKVRRGIVKARKVRREEGRREGSMSIPLPPYLHLLPAAPAIHQWVSREDRAQSNEP